MKQPSLKFLSLALVCALFPFISKANDSSPIPNVDYSTSSGSTLTVQNISSDTVIIDIYGEKFTLAPTSGLSFECQSQSYVELQVEGVIHDYFEVSCPSKVTFNKNFKLNNL